jgi:streptomycin 6-kinase
MLSTTTRVGAALRQKGNADDSLHVTAWEIAQEVLAQDDQDSREIHEIHSGNADYVAYGSSSDEE